MAGVPNMFGYSNVRSISNNEAIARDLGACHTYRGRQPRLRPHRHSLTKLLLLVARAAPQVKRSSVPST